MYLMLVLLMILEDILEKIWNFNKRIFLLDSYNLSYSRIKIHCNLQFNNKYIYIYWIDTDCGVCLRAAMLIDLLN